MRRLKEANGTGRFDRKVCGGGEGWAGKGEDGCTSAGIGVPVNQFEVLMEQESADAVPDVISAVYCLLFTDCAHVSVTDLGQQVYFLTLVLMSLQDSLMQSALVYDRFYGHTSAHLDLHALARVVFYD